MFSILKDIVVFLEASTFGSGFLRVTNICFLLSKAVASTICSAAVTDMRYRNSCALKLHNMQLS